MTMIACPCCGQPTRSVPVETMTTFLSPIMSEMVLRLSREPGSFVLTSDLAYYIWRREPTGGPENAGICISSAVARNRARLRAMGWDIESRIGQPGGYRLVQAREQKVAA